MLRKGIVLAALCLLLPAVAAADQTSRGPWEITLGAAANNGPNFNGFEGSGEGSVGFFLNDAFEVSLRQSAMYSDISGARGWDATTRVALDVHLPVSDALLPYFGANIGYLYGNAVRDTWEAAPEAGIKWFVNPSTFIYLSAEYQFFFNQNSTANSVFRNGQFIYGVGVGFRF